MPRMQENDENAQREFDNLDELAIPAPAEENNQKSWSSTLEDTGTDRNHIQYVQYDSEADEYDPPYEYENLDELKAPSPAESSQVERPQGYLEDQRSSFARSDLLRDRESPRDDHATPKENTSTSSSPSDPDPEKNSPLSAQHQRVSRFVTEFYTISHLIFFSILGTLARLGLQALTFYPGAPTQTGVLWPNVAGSLIIGFLIEDRKLFSEDLAHPSPPRNPHNDEEHSPQRSSSAQHNQQQQQHDAPAKKTISLYIGLATGFCGSLTSFSSFIRDAFLALANALPTPISHTSPLPIDPASTVPRNGGYSFMALLAIIITTVALCLSALITGAHLALAVQKYTPSIPSYLLSRRFLDWGIVFLAWGSWLGAVVMAIWPPDRRKGGPAYHGGQEHWRGAAIFATVFAPLGCLLRFYLSLHLNSKIASFPMGTFAVNMIGTALEGMFWDLQHSGSGVAGGRIGCQVLQGMMDGFCGAATTVSTWVAEIRGLRRGHAWVYGGVSVLVALGVLVGAMGGVLWGRGWERPA